MFELTDPMPVRSAIRTRFSRPLRSLLAALVLLAGSMVPAGLPAMAADNPSGLPLPRFVSTRSDPINVRVGPGTRYSIAWVYVKAGMPVEIIQEFDTWRKIRDVDGAEGWLHQNLLQSRRTGVVQPESADGAPVALRASKSASAGVRAWLPKGMKVDIDSCDGSWCEVAASDSAENGQTRSFEGFVAQGALWGVYADEVFD